MSEGVQSVRKVMFLITDSAATEVYEATELKNEKTVLKKGPILQKVTCPLQ